MEFLNGGLAWFAAGGLIPIIIHLLHRQRFRRIRWGAMRFLMNAVRKTRRRIRLENLILLLIRILVMVFLALAIARPVLMGSAAVLGQDSNTNYIFVIDNSYSMGYKRAQATAIELARRRAKEILEKISFSSEDTFSLILLSEFPQTAVHEARTAEQSIAAVEKVGLTDYGTSLPRTFQLIQDRIEASRNVDKRIYLFTDMQRTAWEATGKEDLERFRARLARLSKDDRNRFYFVDVGDEAPSNVAVVGVSTRERVATVRSRTRFTAQLFNYSPGPVKDLKLSMFVNGVNKAERFISIDAQSVALANFEHEFLDPGSYRIKFAVDSDFLSKDDARYLALDVKEGVRVLVVDGNPGSNLEAGTKFLQLALDPLGEGRYFALEIRTPETLPAEDLDRFDAAILADCQFITPEKLDKIRDFVRAGGGLLLALGPRVDRDFYNQDLWGEGNGLLPGKLVEKRGVDRVLIEQGRERPFHLTRIQLEHPIFRTFREATMSEMLSAIEFGEYWGVESYPEEGVLAAFQDPTGTPAFVEKPFGEGRVILFGSTLNKEWSLFPVRNAYLPVMIEIVRYLSSRPLSSRNVYVGDPIHYSLPVSQWAPEFRLRHADPEEAGVWTVTTNKPMPGQRRVSIVYPSGWGREEDEKARKDEELRNRGTQWAGHYSLEYPTPEGRKSPMAFFAVNVGPRDTDTEGLSRAEGNLDRIEEEEIRRLMPGFKFEVLFKQSTSGAAKIDPTSSSLWKLLLFIVLGLLASESLLAWLFGRGKE